MRAGKLDRIITIDRKTETVSASGAVASAWSTLATVRAELVDAAIDERAIGYGEADEHAVTFRCWWRPGIETADRITHAGKHFDIKRVVEIGRQRLLELHAVAVS